MERDLPDFLQYEPSEEQPFPESVSPFPTIQLVPDPPPGSAPVDRPPHRILATAIATLCGLFGVTNGLGCVITLCNLEPRKVAVGIFAALSTVFWFRCMYRQYDPEFRVLPSSSRSNGFLCALMCAACIMALVAENAEDRFDPYLMNVWFAIIFGVLSLIMLTTSEELEE